MDYVDFDSLAQKLAPTLQVLENKRKELLRKGPVSYTHLTLPTNSRV